MPNIRNFSIHSSIEDAKNAIPHSFDFPSRNILCSTACLYFFSDTSLSSHRAHDISACRSRSLRSSIVRSKNDISLGFFTSIAKYLPFGIHPMISAIPGLICRLFLCRYIPRFASKYPSDTILSAFTPIACSQSSISDSMYSSFSRFFMFYSL